MSVIKRKRRVTRKPKKEERELRSPFDLTANLYAYVPREAIERSLRFTVRALRKGKTRIVVTGPAGIGKTLLLHMIGDSINHELGFVYLPYAALPPDDLCTWALGRMERPRGDDPIGELTQYARELGANDKALLMLLDDASTMSLATARWLSELVTELDGALRLVFAATDSSQVEPLVEALGPDIELCRLDQPLTLDETREYVTTRLEIAMAPESTHSRFDEATINAIHRASDGNPRQVHQVASAVMRGISPESIAFEPIPSPAAVSDEEKKAPEASGEELESEAAPAEKKKTKPGKKRKRATKKKNDAAPEDASPANEPDEAVLYAMEPPPPEPRAAAEDPPDLTEEVPAPKSPGPRIIPVEEALGVPEPHPDLLGTSPGAQDPILVLQESLPELQQPRQAPLTPLAPMRVFRSVGIIAAALVAMVLARPTVHLNAPVAEIVTAPRVIATIATELPPLPAGIVAPKPVDEPKPRTAEANGSTVGPLSVQVNATPWARIEVDGVNFGATPVADIPLLPGEHIFKARMSDGRILEKVVEIDDSKRFVSFE